MALYATSSLSEGTQTGTAKTNSPKFVHQEICPQTRAAGKQAGLHCWRHPITTPNPKWCPDVMAVRQLSLASREERAKGKEARVVKEGINVF